MILHFALALFRQKKIAGSGRPDADRTGEGVVACRLWLPRSTLVFSSSHRLGVSLLSLSPTPACSIQSFLTLTRLVSQSFIAH